jgi:hypothetical protein
VAASLDVPALPGGDAVALAGIAGVTRDGGIALFAYGTPVMEPGRQRSTLVLYLWDRDNARLSRLGEGAGPEVQLEALGGDSGLGILTPLFPGEVFVRVAGDHVVSVATDEAVVRSFPLNGGPPIRIESDLPVKDATADDLDAAVAEVRKRMPNVPREVLRALRERAPAHLPVVAALEVDALGNVWLLPSQSRAPNGSTWRVLSAQGELIGYAETPTVDRVAAIEDGSFLANERTRDGTWIPCRYVLTKSGT